MLPYTEPVKGSIATKWKKHVAPEDAVRIKDFQLYDLDTDIGETKNIADDLPQVVESLKEIAQRAREDIGDYNVFGEGARDFGAKKRTLVRP